jgi:membrane protein implicated in regulation of membrane protease activity
MVVFHRLLGALIGLLLLAIGVTGLTLGFGALGSRFAHMAPLPAALAQHAMAPTDYDLIVLALLGLLTLLVGLLLLRAELRTPGQARMRDLRYQQSSAEPGRRRGRTGVRTGGLEHGLRQSLEALPDVRWTHAQLAGNPERPNLLIELEVDAEARLSTLKSDVGQAIERFQLTSGRQPSTQVRIRLAPTRRSVD